MRDQNILALKKWPFLLGDFLLVGLAAVIIYLSNKPIELWQALTCLGCVGAGAWLAVIPFLQEYQSELRLAETDTLASRLDRIQNIERIALHQYDIGGFRIDLDRELVIRPDGVEVRPRPQAFAVLRHLALNAGRIVGKDELVGAVWPGIAVTDDSPTTGGTTIVASQNRVPRSATQPTLVHLRAGRDARRSLVADIAVPVGRMRLQPFVNRPPKIQPRSGRHVQVLVRVQPDVANIESARVGIATLMSFMLFSILPTILEIGLVCGIHRRWHGDHQKIGLRECCRVDGHR
jgi:hypothetical protein